MQVLVETDRLILRRFTADDAQHLFDLDNDPEVMRYLNGGIPTPRDVVESEMLPRFLRYDEESPGIGFWAAIERSTMDFLGWFSLRRADPGSSTATLGYRLRRATWGRGYATEGARALVRIALLDLGVARVTATTYQDNLASRRVMEKLGMKRVRRFHYTVDDLANVDTYHVGAPQLWDGDDLEYALERDDWERQGAQRRL